MGEDVEEVEVKSKTVSKNAYVCSVVAFLKVITENKSMLCAKRMKLLHSAPFWKIIDAFQNQMIEEKYVKKSDHALTMLLQALTWKQKALRLTTEGSQSSPRTSIRF